MKAFPSYYKEQLGCPRQDSNSWKGIQIVDYKYRFEKSCLVIKKFQLVS